MTTTLRPYLPYAVILAIGALISVVGLTLAHYNDRTETITPAVVNCALIDQYGFPMPDYCYGLR